MADKTYTKDQLKQMRKDLEALRKSNNDQKLLSKFMTTWGMPHNVTPEAFVEQCAESVAEDAVAAAPADVGDEKKKPEKTG